LVVDTFRNETNLSVLENRGLADSFVTPYRPDVDGLRAIAVMSVIAFHLSQATLPGGYFGVDIFFVLSGYLITSIIWREMVLREFSLTRFYDRRIRRIMPALLVVLAVTTVASLFILLPIDLMGFGRSLLATVAFVANIYFWRDTDYFSRVAEEKPLLHIWSLGVEEQFYMLFPLLLLLIAAKARKRVAMWIGMVVIGSVLLNVFLLRIGGALPAFYLLPTRAWELAVGALIAVKYGDVPFSPRSALTLSCVGLVLISFGLLTGRALLPSWMPDAVPVVVGTGVLLLSGSQRQSFVYRCLSSRPVVFVGLISYSLYLWHWPVIVLLKYYLVRDLRAIEVVVAVGVMTLMAVLSWRYVERPFRSRAMPMGKIRYAALGGMFAAVAIGMMIIAEGGFPSRLSPDAARINAAVGTNYRCPVSDYLYLAQSRACVLELPSRDPDDADVILLGNSHAQMYAPVIRDILHSLSLHGLLVPANACLPTWGVNIYPACIDLANRNIEAVSNLKRARVVVIGTTWNEQLVTRNGALFLSPSDGVSDGLDRTIDRLLSVGKKVVVIGPIPIPNWDVASVTSRSMAFGRPLPRLLYEPQQRFQASYAGVFSHFEARRDIEFVRADKVMCGNGRCNYVVNGVSLYADDNHLAAAEVDRFRPALESVLRRAAAR
jgi:peptidoglycan/LPS O-acetylase OafA/YrhL